MSLKIPKSEFIKSTTNYNDRTGKADVKERNEVWAKTCIQQGWKYGEQRNDELKTHPCLVPYEELPEEGIEYDRKISIGTLS